MCGGGDTPTVPTVDPAAERQKAADEAAKKANAQLVFDSRRKRGQQGLLAGDEVASGSVLSQADAPAKAKRKRETVMGSAE